MVAFLCLCKWMRHCRSVGFTKYFARSLQRREVGNLLASRILILSAVLDFFTPTGMFVKEVVDLSSNLILEHNCVSILVALSEAVALSQRSRNLLIFFHEHPFTNIWPVSLIPHW